MTTYYKKVSVKEGGNPKTEGLYDTSEGCIRFKIEGELKYWQDADSIPDWWLKEITLPEAVSVNASQSPKDEEGKSGFTFEEMQDAVYYGIGMPSILNKADRDNFIKCWINTMYEMRVPSPQSTVEIDVPTFEEIMDQKNLLKDGNQFRGLNYDSFYNGANWAISEIKKRNKV